MKSNVTESKNKCPHIFLNDLLCGSFLSPHCVALIKYLMVSNFSRKEEVYFGSQFWRRRNLRACTSISSTSGGSHAILPHSGKGVTKSVQRENSCAREKQKGG
jgi:hypothetical protein